MAPGKLDQSLEDIVKSRRGPAAGRRVGGRRAATTTKTAAPTGGITKKTKSGKPLNKVNVPAVAAPLSGESKIMVHGLPSDVTEQQIKDYFGKVIGPVKKVFLTYNAKGASKGISTIVFSKPNSAHEAATQLNGVKIDGRAMSIEIISKAAQVAPPAAPKTLSERVAQPKSATKSVGKAAANGAAKGKPAAGKGRPAVKRGRNAGRGKPKTAEELDAEMTDYFDTPANGTAVPAAAPAVAAAATGGDTGMDDVL